MLLGALPDEVVTGGERPGGAASGPVASLDIVEMELSDEQREMLEALGLLAEE